MLSIRPELADARLAGLKVHDPAANASRTCLPGRAVRIAVAVNGSD